MGLHCASVAHAGELLSARSSHRRSVPREVEVTRAHRGATAYLDAVRTWPAPPSAPLCRAKACVKRTTCLSEILKPTTALHNDGLSSLKLFTVPHTIQVGQPRHRWSINCDALRCAYLYTRLPSATSRTARDTGRVIVLCTASAVGADGVGSIHWMPTEDWGALALSDRCVVVCPPVHQLHS